MPLIRVHPVSDTAGVFSLEIMRRPNTDEKISINCLRKQSHDNRVHLPGVISTVFDRLNSGSGEHAETIGKTGNSPFSSRCTSSGRRKSFCRLIRASDYTNAVATISNRLHLIPFRTGEKRIPPLKYMQRVKRFACCCIR